MLYILRHNSGMSAKQGAPGGRKIVSIRHKIIFIINPYKAEAQTALFKAPVRTAL